jgi:hypothetical protein
LMSPNPSIARPRRASSDETPPPTTVLRRPVVPDRLLGLSRPIRVTAPYIAGKDDTLLLLLNIRNDSRPDPSNRSPSVLPPCKCYLDHVTSPDRSDPFPIVCIDIQSPRSTS